MFTRMLPVLAKPAFIGNQLSNMIFDYRGPSVVEGMMVVPDWVYGSDPEIEQQAGTVIQLPAGATDTASAGAGVSLIGTGGPLVN